MTKAEKKIADLEKRVRDLEARPQTIILPVMLDYIRANNPNPWYTPIVTCTSGATTWSVRCG